MKKAYLIIITLIGTLLFACKQSKPEINTINLVVDTPFDMPHIKSVEFSSCEKLNIVDFGAKQGDQNNTTKAIEAAICRANELGGAIVEIPKGEWLTGKIHLKSNVNLHLREDAELIFSDLPEDYLPVVQTSWEGIECYNYSPLIYAYNCENIAITGKGKLKAKMDIWEKRFKSSRSHLNSLKKLYLMSSENIPVEERQMVNDTSILRPQFIQFNRCEKVLLDDISIINSPFWIIHPFMSKNIVIRDVKFTAKGQNNNGINPEMVQNMLIEGCVFDLGDDAVAIKSGRNYDGWRLNTPSKNLIVRNCLVKNGQQLLSIGSELSGGVQNIYIDSCEISVNAALNYLLYIKTNDQRGGYVNNIHMSNVKCGKIKNGIFGVNTDVDNQGYQLLPTYEKRLTPISNILLENIHATKVEFITKILGQEEMCVKNIMLKNVTSEIVSNTEIINENVINFERVEKVR